MWLDQQGNKNWKTFCDIPKVLAVAQQTSNDAAPDQELLQSALRESVRHHLISDVPVGIFLSSGLDSTTLAALAAEEGGQVRTVTLGFEQFRGTQADETQIGRAHV